MMVGIYPVPDEINILWSSGEYNNIMNLKMILPNFVVLDGWMLNGDELIDPIGNRKKITTVLFTQYGNVFWDLRMV